MKIDSEKLTIPIYLNTKIVFDMLATIEDAIPYVDKVLDKVNKDAWGYYINGCLPFDEDVMAKIPCGDRRTKRWCDFVAQYNFNEIEIRDKDVKELIVTSAEHDVKNVRAVAMRIRRKNTL